MKSRGREVYLPGLLLLKMKTLLLKMKTKSVLSGGSSFSGHCSSFIFLWFLVCSSIFSVLPLFLFSPFFFCLLFSQFSPGFFSLSVLFFSPSLSDQPLAFFVPPLPGSIIPPLFSSFFFRVPAFSLDSLFPVFLQSFLFVSFGSLSLSRQFCSFSPVFFFFGFFLPQSCGFPCLPPFQSNSSLSPLSSRVRASPW